MNKSNILTLAKYSLKESFFPYMPRKTVPNMPKSFLGRILLLIWTYIFFGAVFTGVFKASAYLYVANDMDFMYFTSFGMSMTLMVFLFYLPQIFSNLYTKSAIANYQTMPISEGELFVGKAFGGVLSFVDFLLYLVIGLVIYFGEAGFDPWVLVMGILLYLPMVYLPYGILSLFLLVIKKFTNVNRHAKLFKTIGYLIMFGIMGVIYYFSFSASNSSGMGKMNVDINQITQTLSMVSNVFFNAKIYGLAVAGTMSQRLIFTGLIFALCLLLAFISYKIANKFYYEAVFDEHLDTSKKEATPSKDIKIEAGSQFKAIFKKDLKTLFSNIVFLSGPLGMVMVILVMGFVQARTAMEESGVDPASPELLLFAFLISLGVGLFIWLNGGLANTALSREGKSFYLIQTLPIDPKSHMRARFAAAYVVACGINLILALAYTFLLKLTILGGLVIFVGLSLTCAFATMVSLYFGTFMVYTQWKKPQEIQQSGGLKAVGIYLGSLLVMGLLGLTVFAITELTDNILIGAGTGLLVVLIIVFLVYRATLKKYTKGFMDV
ncbi:hypothetical protein HMPREF0072_0985 [Anaerococcus lactolyticus ATCC 51172]|uniref:Uncharacterized protein n=1 Tax=Anaerococcus lactolyticus ATCC 51172 TaxID=525254 RepID=C2BF65_9FIRM|nr:hypothetical protein [Anaerococcus lactolyticus]EEI86463.1 hypothetical protein HMPREF0072_0985 [Anaerococcus lactolyticus ATCC 51172]